MRRNNYLWLSVLMTGSALLGRPAFASDAASDRATLRGLAATAVLVETVGTEAQEKGLSTETLQSDVEKRLKDAGLPGRLSPHSFRVAAVTDLLTQGVPLVDVQYLAGHSEPRTTALYDRRQKKVTRNIVERISS